MKRKRDQTNIDNEETVPHKKQKVDEEGPPQLTAMEIREQKSLKFIRRQKGFEGEREVLGEVSHESGRIFVDGEESIQGTKLSIMDDENFSTPFNMNEERETGRFQDKSGNFRSERIGAGEDGMEKDFWADHLEELEQGTFVERRKILSMSNKRKEEESKAAEKEEEGSGNKAKLAMIKELITFMEKDKEKVKKTIDIWKKKDKLKFDRLLEIVTNLCMSGFFDIYDETKSSLEKKVSKFEAVLQKKKKKIKK